MQAGSSRQAAHQHVTPRWAPMVRAENMSSSGVRESDTVATQVAQRGRHQQPLAICFPGVGLAACAICALATLRRMRQGAHTFCARVAVVRAELCRAHRQHCGHLRLLQARWILTTSRLSHVLIITHTLLLRRHL